MSFSPQQTFQSMPCPLCSRCSAGFTLSPLSKAELYPAPGEQEMVIYHSLSRSWRLGHAVLHANRTKTSPIDTILQHTGGKLLCVGKVSVGCRPWVINLAAKNIKVHGAGSFCIASTNYVWQINKLCLTEESYNATFYAKNMQVIAICRWCWDLITFRFVL